MIYLSARMNGKGSGSLASSWQVVFGDRCRLPASRPCQKKT